VLAERGGGAEHPEETVAQRLGRYDRVEQLAVGLRLQEPDETVQREIGIGGGPEGFEQHRIIAYAAQLRPVQQPLGGGGIGEPVPQQPAERTAPAPRRRHPRPSRRIKVIGDPRDLRAVRDLPRSSL